VHRCALKKLKENCRTTFDTLEMMGITAPFPKEEMMLKVTEALERAEKMNETALNASYLLPRNFLGCSRGKCTICMNGLDASDNHVSLRCGHFFCLCCWESLPYTSELGETMKKACPNCREKIHVTKCY
jgi:hypothetical protein